MPKPKTQPALTSHEIHRTLVLSTGHITRRDSQLLDRDIAPVVSFVKARGQGTGNEDAFGYWVHVPDDRKEERFMDLIAGIRRAGYSRAFADLLTLARALGCQWLMLDRDGVLRPDLPRFEW